MINVVDEDISDFFAHFGIKGMRWKYKKGSKPSPGLDYSSKIVSLEDFKKMRNLIVGTGVGFREGVSAQHPAQARLEEARRNRNLIIGSGAGLRAGLNIDTAPVAKKIISSYASVPISTIRRKQY